MDRRFLATRNEQRKPFATIEVLLPFLKLGLTSFGGPVAHIGYFRTEFVERRRWLSEAAFTDIVALCQFLPGPASSQLGMAIGLLRGGIVGAVAAWIGFTLPSALAMILFAEGLHVAGGIAQAGWLHGLKIVAVAVVAQAVWAMGKTLCPDKARMSVAVAAVLLSFLVPGAWGQVAAIAMGGAIGLILPLPRATVAPDPFTISVKAPVAVLALALFALLLFGLPVWAAAFPSRWVELADSFFRAGSLVFGGGHVVLPLLDAEVVRSGWIGKDTFLAGYGATQAVPGPLFTFAAFLGASMSGTPNGWIGGLWCLTAIFLPSFLLVLGMLPFWAALRHHVQVRAALAGVNAAVVGLLLAALYSPVSASAILAPLDFGLALLSFLLLVFWRLPPWLVVIALALLAHALY